MSDDTAGKFGSLKFNIDSDFGALSEVVFPDPIWTARGHVQQTVKLSSADDEVQIALSGKTAQRFLELWHKGEQ